MGRLQKGHRSALSARAAHTLHTVCPHSSAVSISRLQQIPHLLPGANSFFISSKALAILSTTLFSSVFDWSVFFRLVSYSQQHFLSMSRAAENVCIYYKSWKSVTASIAAKSSGVSSVIRLENNSWNSRSLYFLKYTRSRTHTAQSFME